MTHPKDHEALTRLPDEAERLVVTVAMNDAGLATDLERYIRSQLDLITRLEAEGDEARAVLDKAWALQKTMTNVKKLCGPQHLWDRPREIKAYQAGIYGYGKDLRAILQAGRPPALQASQPKDPS